MVDAGLSLRLHVISDTAAVLTRQFHAPRDLVFRATTEAEHIEQWWGPHGHQATVIELDLRVGGRWRFLTVDEDGQEHAFTGVYRELVPPTRVVQTFTYDVEPFAQAQSIDTVTFEEFGEVTTVTTVGRYPSPELLDVMLESGLEQGAAESYDRLQYYLDTLR